SDAARSAPARGMTARRVLRSTGPHCENGPGGGRAPCKGGSVVRGVPFPCQGLQARDALCVDRLGSAEEIAQPTALVLLAVPDPVGGTRQGFHLSEMHQLRIATSFDLHRP